MFLFEETRGQTAQGGEPFAAKINPNRAAPPTAGAVNRRHLGLRRRGAFGQLEDAFGEGRTRQGGAFAELLVNPREEVVEAFEHRAQHRNALEVGQNAAEQFGMERGLHALEFEPATLHKEVKRGANALHATCGTEVAKTGLRRGKPEDFGGVEFAP